MGSIPRSGRSPAEGNGQPTPVFLPEKSHGQRSLVGSSPWGHKESDTTWSLHDNSNNCQEHPFSRSSPNWCLLLAFLPLAPIPLGKIFVVTLGLSLATAHGGFSCHGARASCPEAWGILFSQPRIEPTSPVLEGGFLTTGWPGNSPIWFVTQCPLLRVAFLDHPHLRWPLLQSSLSILLSSTALELWIHRSVYHLSPPLQWKFH